VCVPLLQMSIPSDAAPEILKALTADANAKLGALLQTPLEPFNVGGAGNFPYYYTLLATNGFNPLTYAWINRHLVANQPTATLSGEAFTSPWITVFSKIGYYLSAKDQQKLNDATQNSQAQQGALQSIWQSTFGSLPPTKENQTVIQAIFVIITTQWAVPSVSLNDVAQSKNLRKTLNNAPPDGYTIFPAIASYLQALGSAVPLANQTTLNGAYLASALDSVQFPTATNGGIALKDNNNKQYYAPGWRVNTSLADIQNGLKATSNQVSVELSVHQASSTEYSVSVNGSTAFRIPFAWFFTLSVGASANYFQENIVAVSTDIKIKQIYPGLTAVRIEPPVYNLSNSDLNWYWQQPVIESIKNGNADVSGFKFAVDPQTDFSANGPFGFPQTIAISQYPTFEITITSTSFQSIAKTFNSTTTVQGTFLGIPLFSSKVSYSAHTESVDEQKKTVTINLSPPGNGIGQSIESNVAWVLGASNSFPGANAASSAPNFHSFLAARHHKLV